MIEAGPLNPAAGGGGRPHRQSQTAFRQMPEEKQNKQTCAANEISVLLKARTPGSDGRRADSGLKRCFVLTSSSLVVLCSVADGSPMSWWLDRDGERRSYWGGFLPGVQQCSCSLEENCLDMNYFCNCDADREAWYR